MTLTKVFAAIITTAVFAQDASNVPWMNEKEGAWYRTKSAMSSMEMFIDQGLKEKGADYFVLVSVTHMTGVPPTEQATKVPLQGAAIQPTGSEEVEVDGAKYACDIYETETAGAKTKTWVVKDGDYKGQAAKMESDTVKMQAKKFSKETVTVKDRSFDCVVVETAMEAMGTKMASKVWMCATCPVPLRSETAGSTMSLVDFGDDWSKRPEAPLAAPPPPPPPPPPPATTEAQPPPPPKDDLAAVKAAKVRKSMDEADALVKDVVPAYKELAGSMQTLPANLAMLRELLKKVEAVEKKLYDAQLKYTLIKSDAPDPQMVDARIRSLDKLIGKTQEWQRAIKNAMK